MGMLKFFCQFINRKIPAIAGMTIKKDPGLFQVQGFVSEEEFFMNPIGFRESSRTIMTTKKTIVWIPSFALLSRE